MMGFYYNVDKLPKRNVNCYELFPHNCLSSYKDYAYRANDPDDFDEKGSFI